MPFLRVIRDKRGYETTYLMHWYREGSRQHSRILYVFRSPGGVRVGREPLEPEVLRQIETQHPDISFDWRVVRDNQQVVDAVHEPRRRRPARPEEAEAAPGPRPAEAPAPPVRLQIPSTVEGDTPDAQIAFLTQLYPVVRERIPQRTPNAARQETLLALAERLNPTAWTDADQITTGLQQAAEALERLSHVFAKRRRRGKRKSRTTTDNDGSTPAVAAPGEERADSEPVGDAENQDSEPPDSEESSPL